MLVLPFLAAMVLASFGCAGLAGKASAQSTTQCAAGQAPRFVDGFAELHDRLGDAMGTARTCESSDPMGTGDVHQTTTNGLAFWRKSTNTPTFTNGYEHWALTTEGLAHWIGSSVDPPGPAYASAPALSPSFRLPRSCLEDPLAPGRRLLVPQELQQQLGDGRRLLLLDPVPGAFDQVDAAHARARHALHVLQSAGSLIDAPVTGSSDEARGDVNGPTREQPQLGAVGRVRPDAIRLQTSLESSPAVLRAVHAQLFIGEPVARGDLSRGRHLRRDLRGHRLVQVHHVVARQLGQLRALHA